MARQFTLDQLADYLRNAARDANKTVARALTDEAYLTLSATTPFTPVEFGPLRASGRVSGAALTGGIAVEIRFGGPAAHYAIYVHEKVFTKSGKKVFHAGPTKAKFLSETADSRFPAMMAGTYARSLAIFTGRTV